MFRIPIILVLYVLEIDVVGNMVVQNVGQVWKGTTTLLKGVVIVTAGELVTEKNPFPFPLMMVGSCDDDSGLGHKFFLQVKTHTALLAMVEHWRKAHVGIGQLGGREILGPSWFGVREEIIVSLVWILRLCLWLILGYLHCIDH